MNKALQSVFENFKPVLVGALWGVAFLGPMAASAKTVTQLTFLRTLAQLAGDSGKFSERSKSSDYVDWALNRGVGPNGGWKPASVLSSDVLAQTLVQLFGLNPRNYGGDVYRILQREGIVVDRTQKVQSELLAALLDNPVVALKSREVAESETSPHKPAKNGHGHGFGLGDNDDEDDFPKPPGHDDDHGHRGRNGKPRGPRF